MIILPDKNIPRAKFLMPVLDKQWRTPSLFVPKDELGNDVVRTHFRINAKSNDGVIIWSGLFDDRADFDAFLYAIALGTLKQERALWDLPTPNWQPYLGELITYEFITETFLTSTAGGLTWARPIDFPSGFLNRIDCIGAGGSGGASRGGSGDRATGGGGGAWSSISNVSLSATTSYSIGTGGTTVTVSASGALNGNAGGDTTFSSSPTAVLAKGGSGGLSQSASSGFGNATNGGAGGAAASGTGTTKVSGGRGGNVTGTSNSIATGGGGAGGPGSGASGVGAAGNNGVDTNNAQTGSNGGSGGGGFGGSAGTGASVGSTATAGGNGSEYSATPYGSGGGGGGRRDSQGATITGGSGGNYGGGGGGAENASGFTGSAATSGAGIQGMIYIEYEPLPLDTSFLIMGFI